MHLNPATLIAIGGLTVAASGCFEGGPMDPSSAGGSGATVNVTEMVQRPDGSWSTTVRTIPAGAVFRPDDGDEVEQAQRALVSSPCSHASPVVLWEGINYMGKMLCLTPSGYGGVIPLPFMVSSGYTITPIYLYDRDRSDGGTAGGLAFFSCSTSFKFSSAFSSPARSAQQAGDFGICHF